MPVQIISRDASIKAAAKSLLKNVKDLRSGNCTAKDFWSNQERILGAAKDAHITCEVYVYMNRNP